MLELNNEIMGKVNDKLSVVVEAHLEVVPEHITRDMFSAVVTTHKNIGKIDFANKTTEIDDELVIILHVLQEGQQPIAILSTVIKNPTLETIDADLDKAIPDRDEVLETLKRQQAEAMEQQKMQQQMQSAMQQQLQQQEPGTVVDDNEVR